jgi:hypothetical protein
MPSLRLLPATAAALFLASFAGLSAADAPAPAGPQIDLAPEHVAPPAPKKDPIALGAGRAPDIDLVRGLTEQRFRAAEGSGSNTSIGGYGEIQVKGLASGRDGETKWSADVARLVVFVAHAFTNTIRVYTELEMEHSLSCSTCSGAFELEQAYVDWKVAGDALGLRAGLVLVPMGIINQWHEPPTFNGVVRPRVETVVIPSTWREIGAGIFGRPVEGLRYELYGMTGLDPRGLSADGLAGARQGGSFAAAKAWSVTGRVEVEPLLGFVIGASGYAGDAGANAEFYLRDHARVSLSVPVLGYTIDARFRRAGLEWKMLFAEWHLPQSEALMHTFDATGAALFADATRPVPTRVRGAYVEGGYDVLRPLHVSHQLVPFARLEYYDTQSAVPEGFDRNPTLRVREYTFGASYRPIRELAIKADYQLRNRKLGLDERQINVGLGFMY